MNCILPGTRRLEALAIAAHVDPVLLRWHFADGDNRQPGRFRLWHAAHLPLAGVGFTC